MTCWRRFCADGELAAADAKALLQEVVSAGRGAGLRRRVRPVLAGAALRRGGRGVSARVESLVVRACGARRRLPRRAAARSRPRTRARGLGIRAAATARARGRARATPGRADGSLAVLRDHRDAARAGACAHGARGRRARRERARRASRRMRTAASTRCGARSTSSPAASSWSTRPSSSPRCSSRSWACRRSKKTKTGYSTDASVLATLAPVHPIAEKIVEYRELTKLKSTYLDALPRMLGEDGRLHTSFNQTVAATGRLSSSDPNLQNIPVRTEYGRRIRAAFVPGARRRPDGLGGLQPDRAAHPRAPLGRPGPHRGVHQRDGLPPGHGGARLRRRAGRGRAGHAGAGEGGQLRHRLRAVGARAGRHAQDHARRGAGDDRPLLRGVPARARLPRRDGRRGAPRRASRSRCSAASAASPSSRAATTTCARSASARR